MQFKKIKQNAKRVLKKHFFRNRNLFQFNFFLFAYFLNFINHLPRRFIHGNLYRTVCAANHFEKDFSHFGYPQAICYQQYMCFRKNIPGFANKSITFRIKEWFAAHKPDSFNVIKEFSQAQKILFILFYASKRYFPNQIT